MLDWSGGCGTRTIRYASTCSNSPRRNPLPSLRYSVADEGNEKRKFKFKNLKPNLMQHNRCISKLCCGQSCRVTARNYMPNPTHKHRITSAEPTAAMVPPLMPRQFSQYCRAIHSRCNAPQLKCRSYLVHSGMLALPVKPSSQTGDAECCMRASRARTSRIDRVLVW